MLSLFFPQGVPKEKKKGSRQNLAALPGCTNQSAQKEFNNSATSEEQKTKLMLKNIRFWLHYQDDDSLHNC